MLSTVVLPKGLRSNASSIEALERRALLIATPSLVEIPITPAAIAADPALANYRSFDLKVSMSPGDRFVSAGFDVMLSAGQFYRNGDELAPVPGSWLSHPNLAFATFICVNNFEAPSAVLPLTDNALPILSDTRLQAGWAKFGGAPVEATNFIIARLTVRNDAVGTLAGLTYGLPTPLVATPLVESIPPNSRPLGWVRGSLNINGADEIPAGATVYDDVDNDGVRDSGEPSVFKPNARGGYWLVLDAGTHRIRVDAPAPWSVASPAGGVQFVTLADGDTPSGIDFTLHQASPTAVTGRINRIDPLDNAPIVAPQAGVTVFVDLNTNGTLDAGEPTTFSLADGTYRLDNLGVGTAQIRQIVPSGFAAIDGQTMQVVSLQPSQTVGGIDFTNFQNTIGAARGVVRTDSTSPGGAAPLAGWTVFLDRNFNGTLDAGEARTLTAGNGAYDLRAAPGTYQLRLIVQAGYSITAPDGGVYAIALAGGFASGPFSFALHREAQLGRIAGAVRRPGDEVPAGQADALAGWTVYLDADGDAALDPGEARVTTDPAGAYAFDNLPAGPYTVRVNKPAGWRFVSNTPQSYSVALTEGLSVGSRNFLYTNRVMIAGVVFDDKNANGIKDAGENGVRGRRVWVDLNNDGLISAGEPGGYVGEKGVWSFERLVAGTYTVRVEEILGWRNTGTGKFTVTLAAGKVRVGVPFGQQKIVPVAGRAMPTPRNIGILRAADDLTTAWARLA